MTKVPFDEVWLRIKAHAGESFHTITGLEFTYETKGDAFYPSRTKYRIPQKDFRTVFERVPVNGPGVLNKIVRGPAYVWSVLHDPRISRGEW